jgi:hypothetical protein
LGQGEQRERAKVGTAKHKMQFVCFLGNFFTKVFDLEIFKFFSISPPGKIFAAVSLTPFWGEKRTKWFPCSFGARGADAGLSPCSKGVRCGVCVWFLFPFLLFLKEFVLFFLCSPLELAEPKRVGSLYLHFLCGFPLDGFFSALCAIPLRALHLHLNCFFSPERGAAVSPLGSKQRKKIADRRKQTLLETASTSCQTKGERSCSYFVKAFPFLPPPKGAVSASKGDCEAACFAAAGAGADAEESGAVIDAVILGNPKESSYFRKEKKGSASFLLLSGLEEQTKVAEAISLFS